MTTARQLNAQRLMLVGAMSEMPEECQQAVRDARASIEAAIAAGNAVHEEAGDVAFALLTIDLALKELEEGE